MPKIKKMQRFDTKIQHLPVVLFWKVIINELDSNGRKELKIT
jgi:hypothetical protein